MNPFNFQHAFSMTKLKSEYIEQDTEKLGIRFENCSKAHAEVMSLTRKTFMVRIYYMKNQHIARKIRL